MGEWTGVFKKRFLGEIMMLLLYYISSYHVLILKTVKMSVVCSG